MSAPIPTEITDPNEQQLWRDVSRLYEDYCSDEARYPEQTNSFINVLYLLISKLNDASKTAA